MCEVFDGAFLMGSDPTRDKQAERDEKSQHWVMLLAFQIARYPVTVAEYACFVRSGHHQPSDWATSLTWKTQLDQRLDHPVVYVNWGDAMAYVAWLAKQTGQPWRLPSEAEWEKAARWDGRASRIYPWGDTFDKDRANTREAGMSRTTRVGTYPGGASPCGAQDMAGNVWEWTSSLDKGYPYKQSDGREAAHSNGKRVLRGGSWDSDARYARAAFRYHYFLSYVANFGGTNGPGFRVVRAVPS